MTDTTQTHAGEATDGSDFPSREQQAVMNAAALKFGSVAIDRVAGTDSMRMSTPEGDVIVNADGERVGAEGLDHMAIMRLRLRLAEEANRTGNASYSDAIKYAVLVDAEAALFKAQNWLASYCDDEQAGAAITAWHEAKANA